ncbi:MAG: hypothetical protein JL50_04570 [Peptococcaceae bacterium BICA1-7]|nr:MAG: hypothetical protein JL50_04570 [Peptococcaceae bacterium BICA1-7]HBV95897.1 hypothetical protein [Desulfotomaculum sp.]
MVSLKKLIFAVPPPIRQRLFAGECERTGGVIREKYSGKIVYLLAEELSEEKRISSVSVTIPEILGSTLKYLSTDRVKGQIELLEKELDANNTQINPGDLSIINSAAGLISMNLPGTEELRSLTENMSRLYDRYQDISAKYLRDLDKPRDYQSFPFIKITILSSAVAARLCMQSGDRAGADEWVSRAYSDVVKAIKWYCLINSTTDKDKDHFTRISGYPAAEFFEELKEVLASPATKPKYRFPPMEAVYLWSCAEYLRGYQLELESI